MIPGPLFLVELVTTARRRRYFALRVVYGALILLVLWSTYEGATRLPYGDGTGNVSIQRAATIASSFFTAFSWLQLCGLMVVSPAMVVGAISSERERRTIEYLFVSDLSNAEIVIGKTLARLLLIGKLLLVGLPIVFLFRLMGGVPANVVAASFLVACSTTLLVTSIGMCVSVGSARARDATLRVYLVLVALFGLPLLLAPFLRWTAQSAAWYAWLREPLDFWYSLNPLHVLWESLHSRAALGVGLDMTQIWRMVAWHAGLAAAGVTLATWAVRRVHLREATRGTKADQKMGAYAWRRNRRRPLLGDRPMLWKEAFGGGARTKLGFVGNVALGLIVVSIVGMTLYFFVEMAEYDSSNREYFAFLAGMSSLVGSGSLLLQAARASGLATQEKERDTWSSLLATPLTAQEIVVGKVLGNMYAARWGAWLMLVVAGTGLFCAPAYFGALVVLLLVYLVMAWVVSSLGVLYSLRSSTTLRAMGLTLATMVFVGGGYLMCCCPILGSSLNGGDNSWIIGFAPCIPLLLAMPTLAYLGDMGDQGAWFLAAFVVGSVGYAAAGLALYEQAVSVLDDKNGRGT